MYDFTPTSKRNLWIVMGIGAILLILGLVFFKPHQACDTHATDAHAAVAPHADAAHAAAKGEAAHDEVAAAGHHGEDYTASLNQRVWANLLVNSFFFGCIALAAVFFYSLQYAAQAAWSVVFMRIFNAVASFLPIGMALIVIILIAGRAHLHHIYHWMDHDVYDVASPKYDAILAHKGAYFNDFFFFGRILIFVAGWVMYQRWATKNALLEDQMTDATNNWKLNLKNSAIFLVFFGFTSSVFVWDVIMSIDAHWYSTLFGWYVFAGMWIGAIITFNMLVIHLKSRDQLEHVNPSHVHDLGKWMFAISFLWTYLWFSQFMLIWYSNIPEEVVYFQQRWEQYRGLFWITMLVNFVFPMILLMARDTKRNKSYLLFVGVLILIFHWCDTYLLVMPGTVSGNWNIGLLEIGMFLLFLGFFTYWILRSLSKAPLLAKNHPFLEESLHHHI